MLLLLRAQQISITNTRTPEEWQTIVGRLTKSETLPEDNWPSLVKSLFTIHNLFNKPSLSANTFLLWLRNQVTYLTDLELWEWLMCNWKGNSIVGETVIKTCKKWVDDVSKEMIQMPAVEGADEAMDTL